MLRDEMRPPLLEFLDQIDNQAHDDADNDARGQRKIKGEIVLPDHNVAGELARGEFLDEQHDYPGDDEHDADKDQGFRKIRHAGHDNSFEGPGSNEKKKQNERQ